MKIKNLLDEKGFIEGVDYTLTGNVVTKINEAVPSSDELMRECLSKVDCAALINVYIADYTKPDGDLNIALFLNGGDGWRIKNIPAPSIEHLYNQYDAVIASITQAEINRRVEEYLKATDWMVIREMETGVKVPPEIKAMRAENRGKHKK